MAETAPAFGIDGLYDPVEVGRGGMGVVYRVEQPALRRALALKVLIPTADAAGVARLSREGAALGGLTGHPNVVPVISTGVTNGGSPYLLMPYCAAGSIAGLLRARGPLSVPEVLRVGIAISGALHVAHQAGIVHRDVKPGNILLSDYGEPMIADFGISRVVDGYETTGVQVSATFAHSAPEVLDGRPPMVAGDVYSLGSTLFEMLSGAPPFARDGDEALLALIQRIVRDPVPDLRGRGVPPSLCSVLEQAMAKDPAQRPPSMADLGWRLQAVERELGLGPTPMFGVAPGPAAMSGPPGPAPGVPPPPSPPVRSANRRKAWAGLGVAALVIVLGAVLVSRGGRGDSGGDAGAGGPRTTNTSSETNVSSVTTPSLPGTAPPTTVAQASGGAPGVVRDNPLSFGTPALVGPETSQWRVTVGFVQADFTAEALAPDTRNVRPPAGRRYVGVHVQFEYLGPQERASVRDVELRAYTAASGPLTRATPGVPTSNDCWVDETVARGALKQCVLPFEVGDDEVASLLVRSSVPEIWFVAHD